ncbi:arf-GAP with Rho-GAP domain, ANK repeat and PH domain-containing protein 2 [Nerophis ophidion]|uniref:arf-GAP with Rho-GAP domain, ANK repeat and PH domain-containing protein 2 n=1 Tax=Nerophis ophidion TaxID=159077 RepID=UPI002AE08807|nr:arf-GAP with Rho-GAP domain, ANK repeat and PH domain-containing protein 2 [Nerophis ophidion]XP_061769571.1 arf-GAP with Rho-GAP domain, ANK repeat and PH domain-containing protein 2 [Nerophis ophidion]
MLEAPEPSQEVERWLFTLRLQQYAPHFQRGGYRSLGDFGDLTDERLRELQVIPTGHRRRILRSLEALGVWKPPLYPRNVFPKDNKRGGTCQHYRPKGSEDSEGSQTLPARVGLGAETLAHLPLPALRDPENILTSLLERQFIPASSSSSSMSSIESELPPNLDTPEDGPPSAPSEGPSQCPMVDNAIYDASEFPKGPRQTRSYRLRHRPVPKIPQRHRFAAAVQTSVPEHPAVCAGPCGANGAQKAPLERTLTPIAPYGETFLYNNAHSILEQELQKDKETQKKPRSKDKDSPPVEASPDPFKEEYSTVEECSSILQNLDQSVALTVGAVSAALTPACHSASTMMVDRDLYSQSVHTEHLPDISPYACFYGSPKPPVLKVGWLDKLSPQGKHVFQRRWVRFDGESLAYYNSDKEMYSKGMILASAIRQVRGLGDNKFEVVTSLRTFLFRAEREGERHEWMETLQTAAQHRRTPATAGSQKRRQSLRRCRSSTNKRGMLEVRAYKGRVLVSLAGSKVRLCKTKKDYKAGLAICEVELTAANIRDLDRRVFEINTPFKNFCFVAESEREKLEWMEAIQESITETLSDYEVAEKIWFNEANRTCADCRAPQPEWASINLGVVICKKCAGQHRSLGPSISKVRSLKLDSSIWSNELVELFLEVGNQNANHFWAANLPLEEELHSGASEEQRATFARRKYRERKYCRVLDGLHDSEQLNKALCAAVLLPGVLHTMELVFSGADVMCATGHPTCSTPYLLAQLAGQRLQMEFLHQNKLSDFPRLDPSSENPSLSEVSAFMDGFLYIYVGHGKGTALDRRKGDDMVRCWCTLEGGFLSYYESVHSVSAVGRVAVADVVSLAISSAETMTVAGAVFTAELYLQSVQVLVIGAETQETRCDWIQVLTKCLVPFRAEGLVQKDSELVGRLFYKEGHDLYHWRTGWFVLAGSVLHFGSGDDGGEEEVLHLKQLQELTVTTHTEGEEKIQVLLMVESRRTIYIHGFNSMDFTLWYSAITQAAGTNGKALGDQQLTKHGVPIIVESCVAFVTQYGLCQEGVYQRPGDPVGMSELLEDFTRDARNVKLREKEHHLEDVTGTLKRFLLQSEDALLTKELYPYWVSALDEKDETLRVKKYSTFIESLPKTNRVTLDAVLQHLYRIQQCSHINHMPSKKLASVFSSCFFQTEGQTPQEIRVVHDLINNYVTLFGVNEDQVQQMERENSFITRWNDKKDTTFSPAGDLIFEVYLEKREPENCCLIKVSPSMRSAELVEAVLSMRNLVFSSDDLWTTFEVIENAELERPLHHSEKILEQVLEWSTLDCPSSAFLVLKKFAGAAGGPKDKVDQKQLVRGEYLKFNDGCTKLLSGHKFQDKYVVLHAKKLLLYRDIKSTKAEREVQLKDSKCYLGLKKKMKPPSSWGFTVYTEKQQWHFCCEEKEMQVGWVTDIVRMKFSSDLCSSPGGATVSTAFTGGAVAESRAPVKQNSGRQMTDRRISLAFKTSADGGGGGVTPLGPRRRSAAVDICQVSFPQQASPASRQSSLSGAGKKPGPGGGDGKMPQNLLSELNSVLNKTGRSANIAD